MKALSIRQPWAWLIVHGIKDVENRAWRTEFRGRFLVHAATRFDVDGYRHIKATRKLSAMLPEDFPAPQDFQHGGIVGDAELIDCVNARRSPWFSGPFGFVLAERRPMPFIPCRGMLGFFSVPEKVAEAVLRARSRRSRSLAG